MQDRELRFYLLSQAMGGDDPRKLADGGLGAHSWGMNPRRLPAQNHVPHRGTSSISSWEGEQQVTNLSGHHRMKCSLKNNIILEERPLDPAGRDRVCMPGK